MRAPVVYLLFEFDCSWRLTRDIVEHSVDVAYFIYDS